MAAMASRRSSEGLPLYPHFCAINLDCTILCFGGRLCGRCETPQCEPQINGGGSVQRDSRVDAY